MRFRSLLDPQSSHSNLLASLKSVVPRTGSKSCSFTSQVTAGHLYGLKRRRDVIHCNLGGCNVVAFSCLTHAYVHLSLLTGRR